MTKNELVLWITYHGEANSSFRKWIAANPKAILHWERPLTRIDLERAMAFTDQITQGDIQPPLKHEQLIAMLCQSTSAGSHDVTATAECLECDSLGLIVVWSPRAMRAMFRHLMGIERFRRSDIRTCAVACVCPCGRSYSESRLFRPLCEFHSTKMLRCSAGLTTTEGLRELRDWVSVGLQQTS